ncbi:MAG: tRNA (N(6)-L-threonylcarbamoyladenosine(37)-C(2))-methylthiotransferase MtaB [Dissulfurimicrobium sp.]|uniref:tRNA (N(6)-L-threonylcarbamoyladenosine(37)-C(2))- methylthiotransferase MtaB n=1 Tax=Dissulfurimicrobium sp. TaxID=2022436 RepID=UPI004049D6D7
MRIGIYTLGCKVNQFESASIAESLEEKGAQIVSFHESADLYIINTCAVTAKAASQSRQALRRARRTNPEARLIATGCYVQIGVQELMDTMPRTLCLVGNDQKYAIPDIALKDLGCLEVYVGDISRVKEIAPFFIKTPFERTRAFVRIQDGCNAFCSYCIVPYTRGRSRSLEPVSVYKQVAVLARSGVKEMVLTGIHIGLYGRDLSVGTTLLGLLQELCRQFPDIRFRLSSIEPTEVNDEMISWAASTPNFCHHWHISLQSGSSKVLAAMNRHYSPERFARLIMDIKTLMPDAAIGTDILVGFPVEDETEFLKTLSLLEELPITYVHAFPFSKRPGTLASAMKDIVTHEEKARRIGMVRALGEKKRRQFWTSQLGKTFNCLIEQKTGSDGLWHGFTENYIPVSIKNETQEGLRNMLLPVRLEKIAGGKVIAFLDKSC